MSSGHYTAFARNRLDQKWYLFNDSSCTPIEGDPREHIVTQAAYVLFYERINKDGNTGNGAAASASSSTSTAASAALSMGNGDRVAAQQPTSASVTQEQQQQQPSRTFIRLASGSGESFAMK